jgi:hypothetical protein
MDHLLQQSADIVNASLDVMTSEEVATVAGGGVIGTFD